MKLNIKKIHLLIYIFLVVFIAIGGYIDYQHWLNPLGLNPEADPKQHDGSQEFYIPDPFESSITYEDGSRIISIPPEPTVEYERDDIREQEIFEELKQKESKEQYYDHQGTMEDIE